MKNYYFILGIARNALPVEIEAAYKSCRAAAEYDVFQASMMKEAKEAYDCLSNPARREKYDAELGEVSQTRPTGNIHNFRSSEHGVALDIAFNKMRKREKNRRRAVKSIVMALIIGVLVGAALNYGPKYLSAKKLADIVNIDAFRVKKPVSAASEIRSSGGFSYRTYDIPAGGAVITDNSACRTEPSEAAHITVLMRKDDPIIAEREARDGGGNIWYYVANSRFRGWASGKDVKIHNF